MFYIQGVTGRTFEGTLEALRRVEKTARTHPERSVTGQLDEGGGSQPFPHRSTALVSICFQAK